MTDLAPHIGHFFRTHLPDERQFSDHTIKSYKQCFAQLAEFAAKRFDVEPCQLALEHLSAPLVADFLGWQQQRGNSASSCNIRLAAIKSFFRYLQFREPGCLEQVMQILAIAQKRTDRPIIDWLDEIEIQALFDAPPRHACSGLRDLAMLRVCYNAALRVSELTSLTLDSFIGARLESVSVTGKGRRQRELPLWNETIEALNQWLAVRPEVNHRFVFVNARGCPLTADGFAYILAKHVKTAAASVSSLDRKHVTPHVLRHSSAMAVLHATKDVRKVSLWLGHEHLKTTEAYLRASTAEKLEILQVTQSPSLKPGNFAGVQDRLMSILR